MLARWWLKVKFFFVCKLGGDLDESISTSSYQFILCGGVVSWCCKKQDYTALSNMKAEYVIYSFVVKKAMWLRYFLQDLNLTPRPNDLMEMYCDNTRAIYFSKENT